MVDKKRPITLVTQLPPELMRHASSAERLLAVRRHVEDLLKNRLAVLSDEAGAVSSDMEALRLRIMTQGHKARLADLKSARWYRTASEARLLGNLYGYICALTDYSEGIVMAAIPDNMPDFDSNEMDSPGDE